MMRITSISEAPSHQLAYRTSGRNGQTQTRSLPFYRAAISGWPASLGSLVLTSDRQGREQRDSNRLLGEAVVEELNPLAEPREIQLISLVILAGDLYEYPDCRKRGGSGEAAQVWEAFAATSAQVVGVHGNHDRLSDARQLPRHARVLGDTLRTNHLTVAGFGGITGNPKRPQRKTEPQFIG